MNPPPSRSGLLAAGLAFTAWGLSPIYFKAVGALPALEIVAHRVLWSVLLLAALLAIGRRFGPLLSALRQPGLTGTLALTTLLTSSNWLVFVWAINAGRTLEASLGYFINPLVSVLLGALFLGERLRRLQLVAVAVAASGVALRIAQLGGLPWVALFLALTFGVYGLLRKRTPIDPVGGLFAETLIALPFALGYLAWQAGSGRLDGQLLLALGWLLPMAGVITAVPLMLFAHGARELPLATLGFTQYLAPTLNFVVAVWIFHEPFDAGRLGAFALIWAALAIYSLDLWRMSRRPRPRASGKITG